MQSRIKINPKIHFGKPCVAGTRIKVIDVLELVRAGIAFEQINKDYFPELQTDDIKACVQYAIEVLAVEDIHITT